MQNDIVAEPTVAQRNPNRKKKVVGATLAMMAISGAAFAYWTTSGSGTGDGESASGVSTVTVNQPTPVTGLAPGSGTHALAGNFDNPNDGPVYIAGVTADSVTVADAEGALIVGCDDTDYTLGGTSNVPGEVLSGDGVGAWSGLTIAFNNKTATNQDACKGAFVTINYTATAN